VDSGDTPFDPSGYFRLENVALWECSFQRDIEYQLALHRGRTEMQSRQSVRAEAFSAVYERDTGEVGLLRVLVTFGVRMMVRHEGDAKQLLHAVEATFALDYAVLAAPDQVELVRFLTVYCPDQAWPFWRQHVYDTLRRASLPVPTLPRMRNGSRRTRRIARIRPFGDSFAGPSSSYAPPH